MGGNEKTWITENSFDLIKKKTPTSLMARHWEWCHFLDKRELKEISSNWCGITRERSQRSERNAEWFQVVTLVCKLLYLFSSHTDSKSATILTVSVWICHAVESMLFSTPARAVYQSALTAAPPVCCNTCTSVQQRSINNNINKVLKNALFVSFFIF